MFDCAPEPLPVSSRVTMTRPLFDVTPYQPDYGCPPLGTGLLFAGMILVGGVSGWLLDQLLGDLAACCASSPIQLMFLGWMTGTLGGIMVRIARVRFPKIAGAAGVLSMIAAAVGLLFSDYQRNIDEGIVAPVSFPEYLSQLNVDQLLPLGIGLFLGTGGSYSVMATAAARPYDRVAEQWKTHIVLGRLLSSGDNVVKAVSTGDLTRLANVRLLQDEGPGVVLSAYVSPRGAPEATIDLQLHLASQEDKTVTREHLGMWTYPGSAGAVLDYLYPGAIESGLAREDVEGIEEDEPIIGQ